MSTEPGRMLSHYRLIEKIGEGGMGVVWKAVDTTLDREVAVKFLPDSLAQDAGRLARFEREAKAIAKLSHPNILEIFDFGREADTTYAVTELLEGETLRERLQGLERPLQWIQVTEIGAAVAAGLGASHERGVVHRDIKPSNIFLCSDGRVKILDFGLAKTHAVADSEARTKSIEAPLTRENTALGTMGYMAPEQVRGEPADPRSDLFALGCSLYEMLTGRRAFPGKTSADVLAAVLTKAPPSLTESEPDLPAALSGIVERCLRKSPRRRFQSAGDLAFALRSLLIEAPAARAGEGAVEADDRPSVAVLPFANLSADPEQEFFCDGMAEEVINALVQVRGLRVVARTSAFAFKGRNEDVREIGRQLNVTSVLEGSVRKAGEKLRITAQLIDVADGYHVWSERFDRRLQDVFDIQDEISLAIVERLQVKLLGGEREAVVKRLTENLEAYEACLKAWHYWNELTPEAYVRSRQCFEEAIRIDPTYARAYAGLAVWYLSQAWWGELSPKDGMAVAVPLAQRALQLDDATAEAHAFMGMLRGCFQRDFAAGERSIRRAVEVAPNSAEAHAQFGAFLLMRRQFDEALAELGLAQELDPLSPTWNAWYGTWRAWAGQVDEGIAAVETVVAMHPNQWVAHHNLGAVYTLSSRLTEAKAEYEKANQLSGGISETATHLACVCYVLGDTGRGDELWQMLQARAEATYVPPTSLALVHLARGEVDDALKELRQAVRGDDPWLVFYRFMAPAYHPGDPRIDALLEEVGL